MTLPVPPVPADSSLFRRVKDKRGAKRLGELLISTTLGALVPDVDPAWAAVPLAQVFKSVWALHQHPAQTPPPGTWSVWCFIAGRGAGKTRAGAEWLVGEAERAARLVARGVIPPAEARLAVVAATANDLRKTITEGPSGLLRCNRPWFAGEYQPALTRIVYPHGVEVHLYSAEEPDRLRGPNFRALWADEFCAWNRQEDTWSNAMFALRLGDKPRALITSTPRPSKLLRQILSAPTTVITRGATADNVRNLARTAIERLYREYEGTRLGRQELFGELLEDNPGALWKVSDIDVARVGSAPELRRIVVAVDPAVTSRPDSDETGIIVAGIGPDGHGYVLADLSGVCTPDQWAKRVAGAFESYRADRVIAEVNNGGELVEATLRTVAPSIPFTAVHASRGKQVRAEPIAAFYEQHKIHHVGHLPTLESQLVQWDPLRDRWSPDRLDALVWALTHLMPLGQKRTWTLEAVS
jgi:phage terminase large subunit-like protein